MHLRFGVAMAGLLCFAVENTLTVSVAGAQVFMYGAGGATLPVGVFDDYAKRGWMAAVGASTSLRVPGVSIGVEGSYGTNSHKVVAGDRSVLASALGFIEYRIGDASKTGLYTLVTVGALSHRYRSKAFPDLDESSMKRVYGIGVGLDIPVKGKNIFVETRFMKREQTSYFPLLMGFGVPIGGPH